MRYGELSSFQTGVAIPVFSLKTADSVGIGEFLDLVPFAQWAQRCGMDLIQILPVNDTGEESSPYSARSAFALNPAYIRLQEIEGAKTVLGKTLASEQQRFESLDRIPYVEVVRFKRHALRQIFEARFDKISVDKKLHQWIDANAWVKTYAVYCFLKAEHQEASWRDWKTHTDPTPKKIEGLWTKHARETLFQAWMQFVAEAQFRKTIKALDALGVRLKGDVPILINEDSADVWGDREYFDLNNRAGAPPDMFSYGGQNWGFPTYRWDALAKDNYGWWRDRLAQASKFYHAYRIDHVLGFFRIWSVPATEVTGILGRFQPSHPITFERLQMEGFQLSTLDYLTRPNFGREQISEWFGIDTERALALYFERLGFGGDRFLLRSKFCSEQVIVHLDEPQSFKDALLKAYWNRVFIPSSDGKHFWPYWYWYNAPVLATLPEHEQHKLRKVILENEESQEGLWYANGMQLLKIMANETDMLVCAEDLGTVPNCVPEVLQELKILALRIERWTRAWSQEGQPYIAANQYPRLSVCTTSCHDSSTLRGLWKEADFDRNLYWQHLGLSGEAPTELGPDSVCEILTHLFGSNSLLAIPPLQDYLAMGDQWLPHNPDDERVNIPGSVGSHNWAWRMPCSVEELADAQELNMGIRELVSVRKARPIWNV